MEAVKSAYLVIRIKAWVSFHRKTGILQVQVNAPIVAFAASVMFTVSVFVTSEDRRRLLASDTLTANEVTPGKATLSITVTVDALERSRPSSIGMATTALRETLV